MSIVHSRFGPLLVWLIIQLMTLSIGALRLPLAARSGNEPQHLAFAEMNVVQITVATMLSPILMREGMTIIAALSALPFLQFAGFLTAEPVGTQVIVSSAVVIWILALGSWMRAIQTMQNRLLAVAILNCFVIGGPVLSYLVAEFSDAQNIPSEQEYLACNPVEMILRQAPASAISTKPLIMPILFLATGSIAALIRRNNSLRDKLSTDLPTPAAQ
jgi:hypothetical protein